VDRKKIIFALLFVVLACPDIDREVHVNAEITRDAKTGTPAT
jgi:hypothetical protein